MSIEDIKFDHSAVEVGDEVLCNGVLVVTKVTATTFTTTDGRKWLKKNGARSPRPKGYCPDRQAARFGDKWDAAVAFETQRQADITLIDSTINNYRYSWARKLSVSQINRIATILREP